MCLTIFQTSRGDGKLGSVCGRIWRLDCTWWFVLPPRLAHSAYGARGLVGALTPQRRRCLPNMPMSIPCCLAWDQINSLSWVDGATQEVVEMVQDCAWEPLMGLVAFRTNGRLTMG